MENTRSTITIFSENKPGVLYRIANTFLRRKINIESLTVSEIAAENLSRFTIVVKVDAQAVRKISKQLEHIVEVMSVEVHRDDELVIREVALIKVSANTEADYSNLKNVVIDAKANIIDAKDRSLIIKLPDTEDSIDAFIAELRQFTVQEIVRSGRIALVKL